MAKHPRSALALKPESSVLTRKLRTFVRWMRDNGIDYSDGLVFELGGSGSVADIGVRTLFDMEKNDLIATIPKQACLTVQTTAASALLEEVQIGGGMGLAVALMYERSLQERSKWFGYLQLLPNEQKLPFLWSPEEIDELLVGTELHKVIKEDRLLIEDDWKESIVPLTESHPEEFPAKWFTLERFLAAKTLVSSRAFEVDEYHGYGMVPLADLFNHKTADEDVHFTSVDSDSESEAADEETEVEETPPVEALQNGRKRDQHAQVKELQEDKSPDARKSKKSKKKRSRRDNHCDVEGHQLQLDIKHEESVKARRSSRSSSRDIRDKDQADESAKAEVGSKRKRKQAPIVKDKADLEHELTEKPLSLRKAKKKYKQAEAGKMADESKFEVKNVNRTQQNDKSKGKHQEEVEFEVQESSQAEESSRRRNKEAKVEEQQDKLDSDGKVFQNTRRGGKLKQVDMQQTDMDNEVNHTTKLHENGKRRRGKTQIEEPRMQLSLGVEDPSDLSSEAWEGNSELLEMILVKDVAEGSEVFNTYGTLSNSALLHRYGFTELNNPFDIVNIDLSLVIDSFGDAFTSRHIRRRVTKWRKVSCSSLGSQDDEYFEITATGKPEEGLLMLIYMVHLSDEAFETLTNFSACPDSDNWIQSTARILGWEGPPEDPPVAKTGRKNKKGHNNELVKGNEPKVDLETWLLTAPVCNSMLEVLKLRDGLYPTDAIDDDEAMLSATDSSQPQKFHALRLRISERSILKLCETNVIGQLDLLKQLKKIKS